MEFPEGELPASLRPDRTAADREQQYLTGDRTAASRGQGTRRLWLYATAGSVLLVVALAFLEPLGRHAAALRATVETMITLLALTAASMSATHFRRSRRARDLVLFGALSTLALIELTSYWLPAALNVRFGSQFVAEARWGSLFVAAALVAASHAPSDWLIAGRNRPVATAAALGLLATAVAGLLGLVTRGQVVAASAYRVDGIADALRDPVAFALTTSTAALLVLAAMGFVRDAPPERDVPHLMGCACVLLAGATLYSIPLPWLAPGWISPAEGLRLLAVAVCVVAAVRHETAIRSAIARSAALAERRRVAEDLHDGLAQDLALIAAHRSLIAAELGGDHPVAIAATRALAVSRGTIKQLSDPGGSTMQEDLEAIAHELSDRFGIAVAVQGDLRYEPSEDTREQLGRIVREAIANAARHGSARSVTVSLKHTPSGVTLRISDDGCGIGRGTGGLTRQGFGLRNMHDRTAAVGGCLTVRRAAKRGTELELVLP